MTLSGVPTCIELIAVSYPIESGFRNIVESDL